MPSSSLCHRYTRERENSDDAFRYEETEAMAASFGYRTPLSLRADIPYHQYLGTRGLCCVAANPDISLTRCGSLSPQNHVESGEGGGCSM